MKENERLGNYFNTSWIDIKSHLDINCVKLKLHIRKCGTVAYFPRPDPYLPIKKAYI